MRGIKFRGKRVDNNDWVYGYLLKADYGLAICEDLYEIHDLEVIGNIYDNKEILKEESE